MALGAVHPSCFGLDLVENVAGVESGHTHPPWTITDRAPGAARGRQGDAPQQEHSARRRFIAGKIGWVRVPVRRRKKVISIALGKSTAKGYRRRFDDRVERASLLPHGALSATL